MNQPKTSTIDPARGNHFGRIWVIAGHAFTQLVRMKVFYFMAVFALIAIASNFLSLPQHAGPESMGAQVLSQIKSWSLGAMTLFSVVLSIVATALLLPKDIEDRTLYTILAKPVPRFDYLAGKLLGVIMLVLVSLLMMDALMVGALQLRTSMVMAEQVDMVTSLGWSDDAIESLKHEINANGSNWSLQGAVLAVFLRAAVMASLALLISTFSTSTLFTTIVSFLLYFIGYFQADARDAYLQSGEAGQGMAARLGSLLVSLIIPDLQLFNVIDSAIEGQAIPLVSIGKLCFVGVYYTLFYLFVSWFVFADKEF